MSAVENIRWGDEINGLRLGIAVNSDGVGTDERSVMLEIFVANDSSKTISLVESHVLKEYEIEILAEDGRLVTWTSAGDNERRAANTLEPSRRKTVAIEPGEIYKVDWPVRLDEWFDLNEPGTYSVRVVRRDWQGSNGLLASGSQTFTVDDRTLKS